MVLSNEGLLVPPVLFLLSLVIGLMKFGILSMWVPVMFASAIKKNSQPKYLFNSSAFRKKKSVKTQTIIDIKSCFF